MLHRGWFRIRYFSISLILSCHPAFSGDGTVSLVKTVGTWALKTVGKAAGAIIAGHAAQQYNANNFDADTGTFVIPSAVSENRGIAVGLQNSNTYETPAEAREQKEYNRLPHEQQVTQANKAWEEKSKDYTQRELDYWIKTENSLIENAKAEANYRKRKGQSDQATHNETRAKEYEATKAILEKEKADRQPRGKIIRQLSDGSLKKMLRNSKEELAFTQKELATENSRWFPNEQKVADNQQIEKNLQVAIKQIEREQQSRTKKSITHTVSTAMVLTSKTAGTDNKTTQMERAPQGGNGGGSAPDPEDPNKKDPKKIIGKGIGMSAVGEGVREVAEEAIKNAGKKAHGESHGSGSGHGESHSPTTTTTTKHDKSVAEHKAYEAQQFEANQKALKQARKAEGAKQNFDTQPFHEKGIEPRFPQDPGQKIHQIEDRTGHFKEFTPAVEEAVRSTIKKEHFDYVENGNSRYTQEVKGIQVWVEVRPDGTIKNFGGNDVFHTKNPVTGKWDRPPNLSKKGPGVTLGIGAALGGLAASEAGASESKGDDFKLSSNTLKALGVNVQEKIKNDPNPFKLPDAPKETLSNTVTISPEMKAIVDRRMEHLKTLSPQDQVKEIMKPMSTIPGLSVPGSTPSIKIPTLTLPTSTSTSFKSGQTSLPVLSSTTSKPPMMPSSLSGSTTKASPSVPQIIAQHKASAPSRPSSYSAPKSSSSSSSSSKSSSGSGFKTSSGYSGGMSSTGSGFKTSSGYSGGGSGSGSSFKTSSGYSGKRN